MNNMNHMKKDWKFYGPYLPSSQKLSLFDGVFFKNDYRCPSCQKKKRTKTSFDIFCWVPMLFFSGCVFFPHKQNVMGVNPPIFQFPGFGRFPKKLEEIPDVAGRFPTKNCPCCDLGVPDTYLNKFFKPFRKRGELDVPPTKVPLWEPPYVSPI